MHKQDDIFSMNQNEGKPKQTPDEKPAHPPEPQNIDVKELGRDKDPPRKNANDN